MFRFPRPNLRLLLRLTPALLPIAGAWSVAAQPGLTDAWQALATAAPREARDRFQQQTGPAEARLGEALATLQTPPTTPESIARARQLLAGIAAETATTTARAARYYLGRTYQLDPFDPDPARAAQTYETLLTAGADDFWSGLARTKLALLTLTILPDRGDFDARLARAEALLAGTANPATRRDLHLVLAEARLYHGRRDETTLQHLNTAAASNDFDEMMLADLLIQRARLSASLGHHGDARSLYREFLHRFPKDHRRYTVGAQLRELEAGP